MSNYKLLYLPLLQIFIVVHLHGCAQAYETAEFYRATKIADIARPRGLFLDPSGDILVVSDSASTISALTETGDGVYTRALIVDAAELELTHSVIHHDGYIYASSQSTVYRWPHKPGSHTLVTTIPEVVIGGMPTGGYKTRILIFDSNGNFYVAIGSDENVDDHPERTQIRRFKLDPATFPIDFKAGEIFADGLHNTVGIAFDAHFDLWGVDNGVDELIRDDLGGDIHEGNPAEELNRLNLGGHHGYPWCFSSGILRDYPKGTQFAHPNTMGTYDDAWCRNVQNNIPPLLSMPAHEAPLGIDFYAGQGCGEAEGAFPCDVVGDAYVALHGSWDSDIPVGYRVARLPFTKSGDHLPTGEIINIIYEPNTVACGEKCFRPVNAIFNNKGHLIISDDNNNEIIQVTYQPNTAALHGLATMLLVIIPFLFY